jgi:hypothetical protein
VRRTRTREPVDNRRLRAFFGSPRRAVEALTCVRRELPDVSVQLRPLGSVGEGAEPETVAIDARVPWRWCRAAVLLVVAIDPAARLEWDEPVPTESEPVDR